MRRSAVILAVLALQGAAPFAAVAAGPPDPNLPRLDASNRWLAPQVGCWNPSGCVSPRIGVVFNAIGPLAGENNQFDAVAYNGFSQFVAERYDTKDGRRTGVGANEVVGGFWGAAQMDTGSDPVDAGMMLFTTEHQTTGHNGMGLSLDYTPNGSEALTVGLSVNPQGRGGVTLGGGFAHDEPHTYEGPSDLGQGTLHAAGTIATGEHLRSTGPTPTLSACGGAAIKAGSTDVKGLVSNASGITSCTVTFAKAYEAGGFEVCMVQDYANANPAPFVSSFSLTSFTVSWPASYSGSWFYICMS